MEEGGESARIAVVDDKVRERQRGWVGCLALHLNCPAQAKGWVAASRDCRLMLLVVVGRLLLAPNFYLHVLLPILLLMMCISVLSAKVTLMAYKRHIPREHELEHYALLPSFPRPKMGILSPYFS